MALEQQKSASEKTSDAETHRRAADAFERLSALAVSDASIETLLAGLLELFVDVADADVGVLRLREGDELRSRAALGLDDEVAKEFSVPVSELEGQPSHANGSGCVITSIPADSSSRSPAMRQRGVRALHCLPLRNGDELIGAVFLGALDDSAPPDEVHELLLSLATRASATVVRRQAFESLRQEIVSRDKVLAMVAHDLRNPINIISLAASTLHDRLTSPLPRLALERIIRGARRADRMVQDLLEVSAIEAGHFAIQTRRVDPADVILAALESQQDLAERASLVVSEDLSRDLPHVTADEERLLEVLENLVGNAIKFTAPGGRITVGAKQEDGEIVFWVKDTGSGMPPEHVPRLFDGFWQSSPADQRGKGLGLTICKAIVEAHGGRIWAESVQGAGTTVSFTLPGFAPDDDKRRVAEGSSILLVDDRRDNLVSLRAALEGPQYRLITAESGEEALSFARRERFSVALVDVAMPGMNGIELAHRLKQIDLNRDTPVIFVTAFGDDPDQLYRAYLAGGADYLAKPLNTDAVRRKVAVFVEVARKREQRRTTDRASSSS